MYIIYRLYLAKKNIHLDLELCCCKLNPKLKNDKSRRRNLNKAQFKDFYMYQIHIGIAYTYIYICVYSNYQKNA